jgi:hypothetical protein
MLARQALSSDLPTTLRRTGIVDEDMTLAPPSNAVLERRDEWRSPQSDG